MKSLSLYLLAALAGLGGAAALEITVHSQVTHKVKMS